VLKHSAPSEGTIAARNNVGSGFPQYAFSQANDPLNYQTTLLDEKILWTMYRHQLGTKIIDIVVAEPLIMNTPTRYTCQYPLKPPRVWCSGCANVTVSYNINGQTSL
jgi:hypothetical protein